MRPRQGDRVSRAAGEAAWEALQSILSKRAAVRSGCANQTRGTGTRGNIQQKLAAGPVQAQRETDQGGDRRPRQGDRVC